jgi:hypothetical protein
MAKEKSRFTNQWITRNSLKIIEQYEPGVLTLRALHYQLVGIGMTNDLPHYKKVVNAMIAARWAGTVAFETFSDLDRTMVGETRYEETTLDEGIDKGKRNIRAWMNHYNKNRWENQPNYIEVFIEKKALQGVFTDVCNKWDVALGACKGYPSLTFLYETANRMKDAYDQGKKCIILYFGDYDASGEDIPRSIQENMERLGAEVEVKRIALLDHQVKAWKLPHAPTKPGDTRGAKWDGIGQVELDAVKPEKIVSLCNDAIEVLFDSTLYDELKDVEAEERIEYKKALKEYVKHL